MVGDSPGKSIRASLPHDVFDVTGERLLLVNTSGKSVGTLFLTPPFSGDY
jgi:hypothetical protein